MHFIKTANPWLSHNYQLCPVLSNFVLGQRYFRAVAASHPCHNQLPQCSSRSMPSNFPTFCLIYSCHGVSLLLKQLAIPTATFHQCGSTVSSLPSNFTSAEAAAHPRHHVFPLVNEMAFPSTVFLQCWTSWHSPPTRFPSAETAGHACHHISPVLKQSTIPATISPSAETTGLPLHRASLFLKQSTISGTVSPMLKQLAFLYTVLHYS